MSAYSMENVAGMLGLPANEHVDAEFTDTSPAPLAVRREAPVAQATFFGAMRPAEKIAYATEVADALKPILVAKKLTHKLNAQNPQDEYVELEGWQTCAGMCNLSVMVEWTKPLANGYEARAVVVRTDTGVVVGAGESMCTRSEANWKSRADFALRSMAQTRAQSRALRGVLAWIIVLAGYKPTPSEEMPPAGTREPSFEDAQAQWDAQQKAAPKAAPKAVNEVAKTAFELAVFLGLVPAGEKKLFVEWKEQQHPGASWGDVLAVLQRHQATAPKVSPEVSQPAPEATVAHEPATREKLEKRVFALCTKLHLGGDERHAFTMRLYAKPSIKDLTDAQVADFGDHLQQLANSHAA